MRKLKKALAKLDDFRTAWLVCLFLLAGLLVCVGVVWLFPGLYGPAFGPAYAVRRQAAQAVFEYGGKTLIGVSWVVTLYVAFQRIVSSDMNLSLTKKAQLEARFAKAVEFLGEASAPGRANATAAVSAITLLESVVREDGESYGRLVFEVLDRYLGVEGRLGGSKGQRRYDLGAALRVLFVIQRAHFPDRVISLRELDLQGMQCGDWETPDRKWPAVDLSGANLEAVDLSGADLSAVILANTILEKATLEAVTLPRRVVQGNWKGATLTRARLIGVEVSGGDWTETSFGGAEIQDTRWVGNPYLAGAVFAEATVRSVNFGVSDLSKSMWSGARVYNVDCSKATVSISRDAVKVQFAAFEEPFYWPKFVGADEKEATAASAGGGSGTVHAPGF